MPNLAGGPVIPGVDYEILEYVGHLVALARSNKILILVYLNTATKRYRLTLYS